MVLHLLREVYKVYPKLAVPMDISASLVVPAPASVALEDLPEESY